MNFIGRKRNSGGTVGFLYQIATIQHYSSFLKKRDGLAIYSDIQLFSVTATAKRPTLDSGTYS